MCLMGLEIDSEDLSASLVNAAVSLYCYLFFIKYLNYHYEHLIL